MIYYKIESGSLITWGMNNFGQLGVINDVIKDYYEINFSSYDNNLNIIDISCGANHSLILNGMLFI